MRTLSGLILRLGLLYAASCALGFALFVAAFQLGVLGGIDILFYRGLILIALVGVLTLVAAAIGLRVVAPTGLPPRDAFAAAVLSLSLNLSFLVIVPVTVDRSISIFMLGQMAAEPDHAFTSDAMSDRFVSLYVKDGRQIERRLHEQTVSGNVAPDGDGYKITKRGLAVVATARTMAWLFDSHAGILAPEPATPPRTAR
jgi:hypothetical protein